jgi:hypothetical protein
MGVSDAPKDFTGMLDKLRATVKHAADTATGQTEEQIEMQNAFSTMLKDLRYPVGPPDENGQSDVMNADFFAPWVAYHLVRCGWRPNGEKRKIKPRKVPQRGVVADAVEWVAMDEPDDPLRNLDTMSMREIALLPEVWKHEAIRRLGGHVKSDLPEPKSKWKVNTKINISNAPRNPETLFIKD